jgi:ribosomal protein S18 acetylase RimI-like enzyme
VIRSAREADADAVVALWTAAYFAEGEGGRDAPYARPDFDATAATAERLLVAELDGTVVGVVALLAPGTMRAVAVEGEAELSRLVVSAAARRRGIGRALTERCTDLARDRGWPAIVLWSRPYQTAAHRLYESLGYRRRPERDVIDETGFGRLVFRLKL